MSWRAGMEADELRRRKQRRPRSDEATLRRLTVGVVVASMALNVILFFQTAIAQVNPGDVSGELSRLLSSVLPGVGGIQPPANSPHASPTPAIATTGGS